MNLKSRENTNMKKILAVALMSLVLSACGDDEQSKMNNKGNSSYSDFENQMLKCSVKNLQALSENKDVDANQLAQLKRECRTFQKQKKALCAYGTDQERLARDKMENDYQSKDPVLYQAYLDMCKLYGLGDPKDNYNMIHNKKYNDQL